MKVSVVIPLYNMGSSIERMLNAILNQSYQELEIIVVDDGSQDDGYNICQKIAEKNTAVKVYHTENRGSGLARNYGIEKATGDYVYFPDADDALESQAIEVMINAVKRNGCDLVVCGYRRVSKNHKPVKVKKYLDICFDGDYVRKHYEKYCLMNSEYGIQGAPWNKLFSLKIIKENNVEYPSLRRHQDEIFIARYVSHTEKVGFISDILYTYYQNDPKTELGKYTIDYSDILEEYTDLKKEIVSGWNFDNTAAIDNIDIEFVNLYILALKLIFNKKNRLTHKERLAWIIEKVRREKFINIFNRVTLLVGYRCQQNNSRYIKKRQYIRLYFNLWRRFL